MPYNIAISPPPLQAGDKIAIVATARKIDHAEIAFATELFREWQLEVVWGNTIGKEHHQFAGTDQERIADLQHFIDQADIKAIVCARGGYGSMRLVDHIDWTPLITRPKWIVGYSDITTLHCHLYAQLRLCSLHASMPINFAQNTAAAIASLRNSLFGENTQYEQLPSHPFSRSGVAQAPLIGGNLSLICALIGSKSDMSTKGKILFLEDLDEYLYHIDRLIIQLKRSGKLNHLAGLIVGSMTDMKDNAIPFGADAYEIIATHTAEYNYPICFNFPVGHIDDNRALIHGAVAQLEVTPTHSQLSYCS